MNFLLFLISILFSFIFYSFHNLWLLGNFLSDSKYKYFNFTDSSLSWNLLYESLIFLIIGFCFFIFFSSLFERKINTEDNPYVKNWLKSNFKIILYYTGFILFYVSIYMILKDLNFDFSYIILFVNTLIIVLFLISKKFFILADLLKINTVIFSSIYIFLFLEVFILKDYVFLILDFINTFVILISFFISLYSDKVILKKKSDSFSMLHFFLYLFFFICFYFNIVFDNISFIFSIFGFLLNITVFNLLNRIEFLKNSKKTLRVVGIFFSYVSIVSWIYFLLNYELLYLELLIIGILFYLSFFNFKIHKLYENYTSFIFFFISFYFNIYYLYYNYIYLVSYNDLNLVFYSFTITLLTVLSTYVHKYKRIYDYYFIYTFGLVLSLLSTFYFFYTNTFDFLSLWIILLLDSIMIFLSYNKLRKIEN